MKVQESASFVRDVHLCETTSPFYSIEGAEIFPDRVHGAPPSSTSDSSDARPPHLRAVTQVVRKLGWGRVASPAGAAHAHEGLRGTKQELLMLLLDFRSFHQVESSPEGLVFAQELKAYMEPDSLPTSSEVTGKVWESTCSLDCDLKSLPPHRIMRLVALVQLEMLYGPEIPNLKVSFRGAYWLLEALQTSLKSRLMAFVPEIAPTLDTFSFPVLVGPLMQQALQLLLPARPLPTTMLEPLDISTLEGGLSIAQSIAYLSYLTHRISIIANDEELVYANWALREAADSPREGLTHDASTSPDDRSCICGTTCAKAFEFVKRLFRAIDPLLKCLELLVVWSGLSNLPGSTQHPLETLEAATESCVPGASVEGGRILDARDRGPDDDCIKVVLPLELLCLELNSLLSLSSYITVSGLLHSGCSSDRPASHWGSLDKAFRSTNQRICGIKGRVSLFAQKSKPPSRKREKHPCRAQSVIWGLLSELPQVSDTLLNILTGWKTPEEGVPRPQTDASLSEESRITLLFLRTQMKEALVSPPNQSLDKLLLQLESATSDEEERVSTPHPKQSDLVKAPPSRFVPSAMIAALDSELAALSRRSDSASSATAPFSTTTSRKHENVKTPEVPALSPLTADSPAPTGESERSRSPVVPSQPLRNEGARRGNGGETARVPTPIEKINHSRIDEVRTPIRSSSPSCDSRSSEETRAKKVSRLPASSRSPPSASANSWWPSRQESRHHMQTHPERHKSQATQVRASWEVEHGEVHLHHQIGSGASAAVYKGQWRGTDVAVKKMLGPLNSADALSKFQREIRILLKLRHPNLALLMGASMRAEPYFLLMEFCEGGDLFTLLHVPAKSPHRISSLTFHQRLKIALDIAKGMNYLHKSNPQIVHRDLKSLNVLLANILRSPSDEPLAKITDFGLSQLRSGNPAEDACHSTAVGTYHWMAPEVLLSQPYNERVDVYSFGVLLFEIFSNTIPYHGTPPVKQLMIRGTPSLYQPDPFHLQGPAMVQPLEGPVNVAMAVAQGFRPPLALLGPTCPKALVSLICTCWEQDPHLRPSFEAILSALKQVAQSLGSTAA